MYEKRKKEKNQAWTNFLDTHTTCFQASGLEIENTKLFICGTES